MPPSIEDVAPLAAISGQLRELADIVAHLGERAAKASEKDSHSHRAPLEQVLRALTEIVKQVRALSAGGEHASQYRQIERSLGAIATAVKGLSTRG